MNIGIFGATGFIGSHLLLELSKSHIVAGFSSSFEDSSKNIVKGQYDSKELVDNFSKNLDVAIYTAGAVNPRDIHNSKLDAAIEKSILELKISLEIFFKNNPNGLFVFFSSAGALYPHSKTINHNEKSEIIPIGFYGLLKYKQEEIILEKFSNKNILILRPSNIFGDPFKKNKMTGVIDRILSSCIHGEIVNIFENLKSERDYLFIDDLTSAVSVMIESNGISKGNAPTVYNISSHQNINLSDVIYIINKFLPLNKSRICYTKIHELANSLKIDSTKLRNTINWVPINNFEQALNRIKLQ